MGLCEVVEVLLTEWTAWLRCPRSGRFPASRAEAGAPG